MPWNNFIFSNQLPSYTKKLFCKNSQPTRHLALVYQLWFQNVRDHWQKEKGREKEDARILAAFPKLPSHPLGQINEWLGKGCWKQFPSADRIGVRHPALAWEKFWNPLSHLPHWLREHQNSEGYSLPLSHHKLKENSEKAVKCDRPPPWSWPSQI